MSSSRPLPSLDARRSRERRIETMCRMMATYNRQIAEELERFLFDDVDVTGLTKPQRDDRVMAEWFSHAISGVGTNPPNISALHEPQKFPTPERMSEFNPHKHPM